MAESCPEKFSNAVEVASAILKQYNGIIEVSLIELVTDLMEDNYAVEELYE